MIRNLKSSSSLGRILVEIYIGAFIEPMMRRIGRRWTIKVMYIGKPIGDD